MYTVCRAWLTNFFKDHYKKNDQPVFFTFSQIADLTMFPKNKEGIRHISAVTVEVEKAILSRLVK